MQLLHESEKAYRIDVAIKIPYLYCVGHLKWNTSME